MPGAPQSKNVEPIPALTKPGQAFFDAFKTLQRETGAMVPPRKSLTLALSKPFASYLSILEMRDPLVALVRIMGTANVNRTRIDNTGGNWFELFPPDQRPPVSRAFKLILDTPRGSLVFVREKYDREIAIEVLTFPFADDAGNSVYLVSTTTQLDLKSLLLRGEDGKMQPSYPDREFFLDIGAGQGPAV